MSTIKAIEFPDNSFETKEELFKHLFDNKEKIEGIKSAQIKNSDSVMSAAIRLDEAKELKADDGFIMSVINTTKYMDSHNDVHLNGIWN